MLDNLKNIILTLFLLLSSFGCATPEVCESSEYEPLSFNQNQLVRFDTDIDVLSTVNSLCGAENQRFDNRFSPYKGGSQSVDIIVEHYSFLGCPHCAHFAAYVDDMLTRRPEIEQRVRFYFHHYPFTGYEYYHAATVAAAQQGMDSFWQFHNIIFDNTGTELTYASLRDIAMYDVQLDMPLYDAATNPNTIVGALTYSFLENEKKIAKANCVYGTPSVYICGERIEVWTDTEDVILGYLQN